MPSVKTPPRSSFKKRKKSEEGESRKKSLSVPQGPLIGKQTAIEIIEIRMAAEERANKCSPIPRSLRHEEYRLCGRASAQDDRPLAIRLRPNFLFFRLTGRAPFVGNPPALLKSCSCKHSRKRPSGKSTRFSLTSIISTPKDFAPSFARARMMLITSSRSPVTTSLTVRLPISSRKPPVDNFQQTAGPPPLRC